MKIISILGLLCIMLTSCGTPPVTGYTYMNDNDYKRSTEIDMSLPQYYPYSQPAQVRDRVINTDTNYMINTQDGNKIGRCRTLNNGRVYCY